MAPYRALYTRFVSRIKRTQQRLKWGLEHQGPFGIGRAVLTRIFDCTLAYYVYKLFHPKDTFAFRGRNYHYFFHTYNKTWRNERTVEIPMMKKIVDDHPDIAKWEVGNLLSHYFTVHHDIVDK
jgi:hypothetical protein